MKYSPVASVALVANEELARALGRVSVHLSQPVSHVAKRLLVGHIVDLKGTG